MGRTSSNQDISSKAKRLKLAVQREPYWFSLGTGEHLGYRKTGDAKGNWIVRYYSKEHGRKFASLGQADDSPTQMGSNEVSYQDAVKAARAEIVKMKRDETAGVTERVSYTVADAMSEYIDAKEREKRKALPHTRAIINSHIKPALGKIKLEKLRRDQVEKWRDAIADAPPRRRTGFVKVAVRSEKMENGKLKKRIRYKATDVQLKQAFHEIDTSDPELARKRQATANRILTVLKAALNLASERQKISGKDAWENVKAFRRVDVPKVRFLAENEVGELVPACEESFAKLVKGALLTGCRYGELTVMLIEAFNADEARLYVAESKNGESRYVDLNDEGVAFFSTITANRGSREHIFLKTNGKPWMKSEQKRPMDSVCEATGIAGVTFHILRHTYASHAVMNGMPIAVLSEQLGHKDTRITERHYAHLSKSYKRKLIRENAPTYGFEASKPGPQLVQKAG